MCISAQRTETPRAPFWQPRLQETRRKMSQQQHPQNTQEIADLRKMLPGEWALLDSDQ